MVNSHKKDDVLSEMLQKTMELQQSIIHRHDEFNTSFNNDESINATPKVSYFQKSSKRENMSSSPRRPPTVRERIQ